MKNTDSAFYNLAHNLGSWENVAKLYFYIQTAPDTLTLFCRRTLQPINAQTVPDICLAHVETVETMPPTTLNIPIWLPNSKNQDEKHQYFNRLFSAVI